jgi:hypothetical protein
LPKSLVIVSDDAGQFNVFNHALCWTKPHARQKKTTKKTDDWCITPAPA